MKSLLIFDAHDVFYKSDVGCSCMLTLSNGLWMVDMKKSGPNRCFAALRNDSTSLLKSSSKCRQTKFKVTEPWIKLLMDVIGPLM